MWEERRGNVRTVTFPCGPLRWTLVNPFGFSHLQEGCRSEGSGQIGKWIGKQQNCSAVIRNTFPCICRAALRLRRLLDDFCFRSAEKCCFRSTSAVSTTTNISFDQGSLSRISSAVIKAKTQKVTFFLLLFFFFFFYQLSVRLEAVTQKMKYPHPCESTVFGWHHSFPTGLSNPALWKGLECAGFILTIDAPEDVFTRPSRASAEILDTFFIYLLFCKYDGVIDLWLVLKRGEEKMAAGRTEKCLNHQEQHGAVRAVRALQFRSVIFVVHHLIRGKFVSHSIYQCYYTISSVPQLNLTPLS